MVDHTRYTTEETVYEIKNELASSKQGWTTKQQVEDLIVRKRVVESDITILTYVAFYTSGDSNRRYQNRYM